jgi:hypothetical protein
MVCIAMNSALNTLFLECLTDILWVTSNLGAVIYSLPIRQMKYSPNLFSFCVVIALNRKSAVLIEIN